MSTCLFCIKVRHGVFAIAAVMFLLYGLSPFIPHILSILSKETSPIDFKPQDCFISGIGCIVCMILFCGAAFKNVWITLLGFTGYVAMIASVPFILYYGPLYETQCFPYLNPVKVIIFVIHMALQLYCISVIGFYLYELFRHRATEHRTIIAGIPSNGSFVSSTV